MTLAILVENKRSRTGQDVLATTFNASVARIDREYEILIDAYTTDDNDDSTILRGATVGSITVPSLTDSYPTDAYALCWQQKFEKVEDISPAGHKWLITSSYKSHFDFDPTALNPNPTLRPTVYTITWTNGERAIRLDLDGKAIENSSGTPFLPPLTQTYGVAVIEAVWNASTLTFADLSDNQDCYNTDVWHGLDIASCLLKGITYTQKWENGFAFYEKKATVHFRSLDYEPLGWKFAPMLDAGFYEIDGSGNRKMILDSYGKPLPEPTKLNGSGVKLAPGADPVYLQFRTRDGTAFGTLVP